MLQDGKIFVSGFVRDGERSVAACLYLEVLGMARNDGMAFNKSSLTLPLVHAYN